ncbi:MAG: hypothetical protein KatS3mg033_1626 [Thermonema sp.]|jgi:hypothetical protein|nr:MULTISPECIES: hypothetical protein [Thermonema]GIV39826.1 MAG: hypothetical protein KatS3mg033_1626 [Thermonema sp.]
MKKFVAFLLLAGLLGLSSCAKRYTCPTYIKDTKTAKQEVRS